MSISSARFERFTVFSDATFEFCPGINVLIGENGTGKSHVLKGVYALCEGFRTENKNVIYPYVNEVYLPDSLSHLIRRGSGHDALIELGIDAQHRVKIEIDSGWTEWGSLPESALKRALFLPPREVLSIYPGFVSAWLERKSPFDRTYFDLCVALGQRPLRRIPKWVSGLLTPLRELLGGNVVLKGDHFFIELPDGDMEMPLFAEGLRKIATIVQLLLNGSLVQGSCLCWDEPEANMNPRLVVLLKNLLLGLAQAGIQVFVATHDFLLTSELSLASRYEGQRERVRFFALSKTDRGVVVDTADDVDGLADNPIVAEFGAHYDREAYLFARKTGAVP